MEQLYFFNVLFACLTLGGLCYCFFHISDSIACHKVGSSNTHTHTHIICASCSKVPMSTHSSTALALTGSILDALNFFIPTIHTHTQPLCTHPSYLKKGPTVLLTQNINRAVQDVELKLLLIPIFFILLRIWSLLFCIIVIEAHVHLNCVAILFFLHMGVSGGVWVSGSVWVSGGGGWVEVCGCDTRDFIITFKTNIAQ